MMMSIFYYKTDLSIIITINSLNYSVIQSSNPRNQLSQFLVLFLVFGFFWHRSLFYPIPFSLQLLQSQSNIYEELPMSDFQSIQRIVIDLHISNLSCNMQKKFFCHMPSKTCYWRSYIFVISNYIITRYLKLIG